MSEEILFRDVTQHQMDALRAHFHTQGMSEGDGTSGRVRVHEVPLGYSYDASGQRLRVEILQASPRVTAAKVKQLVGRLRAESGSEPGVEGLGPGYNHVNVTIDNRSGVGLTFSSQDVSHGVVEVKNTKIPTGESKEAFEARSAMASGLGCEGSLVYQIDSQTTLTLAYELNGVGIHSFTPGIAGFNAGKYAATASNTDADYDCAGAYTYMKPKVTLTKA